PALSLTSTATNVPQVASPASGSEARLQWSEKPILFQQLPQILKHVLFFVRARAIGDKELLAQAQCFSLHCIGPKPVPYRSQELISVHLTFSRVPCVVSRSQNELIEWYFRLPIELRDSICDQPVLREQNQIAGYHEI